MLDSMSKGEAPFASHLMYTQVLDDTIPEERALGMECGQAFYDKMDYMVVYEDYGISPGMEEGIAFGRDEEGMEILYREIGENP